MSQPNRSGSDSDNAEAKLGRGMLYFGWLIALALLAFAFSGMEKSRHNPNSNLDLNGQKEVILKKNDYGHYIFTGLANGAEVDFLLDTGASSVVFTEQQARELGLKKGLRHRVNTANGEISVYTTQIDRLQIGPIVLRNVPAEINPHMDTEALLGMTALGELEWSQSGDTLTIRQP